MFSLGNIIARRSPQGSCCRRMDCRSAESDRGFLSRRNGQGAHPLSQACACLQANVKKRKEVEKSLKGLSENKSLLRLESKGKCPSNDEEGKFYNAQSIGLV